MKKTLSVILSVILIMTFAITSLGLASIAVKSIKLNTSNVSLKVGKTYTLKATITPEDATNKNVTYTSMNKNIATVDKNGKIKGKKAGKTTITVMSSSNKKAVAKCQVTVLKPVELSYYIVGSEQKDLKAVNDEMNKILKEKIDATVVIHLLDWGVYDQKMKMMIGAGEVFDVCFTAPWMLSYNLNATKGAFLQLDELAEKYAQETKAAIPAKMWGASKVNGKLYGIINYQISAQGYGIGVQKQLADKYKFDYRSATKFEDLDPFLAAVKIGEPDKVAVEPNGFNAGMYNMDTIGDNLVPGWVVLNDPDLKVINQYDSDAFKAHIKMFRKWYLAGYLRKDAATTKEVMSDRKVAKYVTQVPAFLFDDSDKVQPDPSNPGVSWGYKLLTTPVITTNLAAATLTAISKTSKNPERAMMFINLMNTNVKLFNLINWGIEGKHYTKISENRIKIIPDSGYAPGTPWEFGNNALLYLTETEADDAVQRWVKVNETGVASPLLSFIFNSEPVKTEIAQCTSVVDEFLMGLITGTTDPDKYQPQFVEKLKNASVDKIIAEKQKQINEWRKANGK